MKARIVGTGHSLPALRVTNDDLSKIMDTSDEWIRTRTGIEARHIGVEETTTSMAAEAARKALEDAGMDAEDLDLIICATVTPDHLVPFLACEVQKELGAHKAAAFDTVAACSGFLFALDIARAYIENSAYRNILVLGAETLSKIMDWTDRSTCVLFGDGAGAAVVTGHEENGILSSALGSDGFKGDVLFCQNRPRQNPFIPGGKVEAETEFVQMNGQEVYKFATRTVAQGISKVLDQAGLVPEDIKYYVLHQANKRILESVAKRLGQPMEKFPVCMQETGNISAASVPILLDIINREGKLEQGDKIILAGFGAGLTWGVAALTW